MKVANPQKVLPRRQSHHSRIDKVRCRAERRSRQNCEKLTKDKSMQYDSALCVKTKPNKSAADTGMNTMFSESYLDIDRAKMDKQKLKATIVSLEKQVSLKFLSMCIIFKVS